MSRVVDGSVIPLIMIQREIVLKYCPLAIDLNIDYDLVVEEDTTNYCEQDTTNFYDFDNPPE